MSQQHFILGQEDNISPNMLQVQIQQKRKRINTSLYVLIYKGLKLMMSNNNMPCSKYRITNRKAVLDAMVDNNFIEIVDKKRAIDEHRGNKASKHYVIAPKGFEYMRAFEKLEGLFD